MPLLLADLIYSRDCKLNLRKNVDTTVRCDIGHDRHNKTDKIVHREAPFCAGLFS